MTLGIRARIALPFTLLIVMITVATALLAVAVITGAEQRRSDSHLASALELASQIDFALSPAILSRIQRITGAEVITLGGEGEVLAATTGDPAVVDVARRASDQHGVSRSGSGAVQVVRQGRAFRVISRDLPGAPGATITMVADASDEARARRRVVYGAAALTALFVLVMGLLSVAIARRITYPIERLVEHTRVVAAGDLSQRVPIGGDDEIGRLARAFDDMTRQLRAAEEKLVHGEKLALAGQLTARIAHDIRTPLSALRMQAQLIAKRVSSLGGAAVSITPLLGEIDRIEWVVDGLLDLARPARPDLAPADLNQVVTEAVETYAPQLEHRRIAVETRLANGLPAVPLDRNRVKQLLFNLLQNASEAILDGGTVGVSTSLAPGGDSLLVEISDNGEGVDEVTVERAFEPFFSTKREGVGLGLVNARSIVEQHGGTIALEPRAGGGARAIVRLPITHPEPLGRQPSPPGK
jgi:signal transduction histidine kinase